MFKPLQSDEIVRIVDLLFESLRSRLLDRSIRLEVTDAAKQWIGARGYDPIYGARPLKRLLQREVETRLGRRLIAGDVVDGDTITVDVEDGELCITTARPAAIGGA